jgi:hypothetical protein
MIRSILVLLAVLFVVLMTIMSAIPQPQRAVAQGGGLTPMPGGPTVAVTQTFPTAPPITPQAVLCPPEQPGGPTCPPAPQPKPQRALPRAFRRAVR